MNKQTLALNVLIFLEFVLFSSLFWVIGDRITAAYIVMSGIAFVFIIDRILRRFYNG